MYREYYEEGDTCPECHGSTLVFQEPENCSCHIRPPCSACMNVKLECRSCGFVDEEDVQRQPQKNKKRYTLGGLTFDERIERAALNVPLPKV